MAAKAINSKAAGRLLAAGGIYNGNRQTAEQLGGDAPAGYDQLMDNKGLLIAGASTAAILTMGKMRFPEREELEHFGARGAASGRYRLESSPERHAKTPLAAAIGN